MIFDCSNTRTITLSTKNILSRISFKNRSNNNSDSSNTKMAILVWILILATMTDFVGAAEENPEVIQENQNSNAAESSNFVRIIQAPNTLHYRSGVKVQYFCDVNSVVVLDLIVMVADMDSFIIVFSKAWKCQGQGQEDKMKTRNVRLRPPDAILYRPDYFTKDKTAWLVTWAKLRAYMVNEVTWVKENISDVYTSSKYRDFAKVIVLPPYSRPFKKASCTIWIWPYIQNQFAFSDTQTCPKENEYVTLLDYPAVFNGYAYSIVHQLTPFNDPVLESTRLQWLHFPQFAVEMWVYILDYCPLHHLSPARACGLFLHMDPQGQLFTPALLINTNGNIQIDVKGASGYIGMKSTETVPKNTWTRIVFAMYLRTWYLHVNYGPDLTQGFWTQHTYNEDLYVDDTAGLWSIGGIEWTLGSFVGYIGRVIFHRRRSLAPQQISKPHPFHPMFELHLARRQEKCEHFLTWMDTAVDVYQKYRRYVLEQLKDVCPNTMLVFFAQFLHHPNNITLCPPKHPYNLRHHHIVGRFLRRAVLTHSLSKNFLDGELEAYSRSFSTEGRAALHNISVELIEKATSLVNTKGLKHSNKIVYLLKQAACLGNDDAMFSLAVMLNNGVGGALDEIQSLAFSMLGALNRHVYSVMALGHRHMMGMDGAPVDRNMAYMYYKQVADLTRLDKELHKESGIATESIRLIDEARIEAQTSELGDLFMWLKHQAEKGVASAQSELGSMLYHGAQGIKRNLQNAMNVFRDGAQMGNVHAMFSYGIMQYRGLGAEANKTEGKRMLQKAAELKNPNAVSALGWMALEVDKNMTQAYEMFQLAKQMGHMDSGYYLGFMYHFGLVPNSSVNLDRALTEYMWSAKRQQIDAGNVYAFLLSRGTPNHRRDIYHAAEWARFIAEKNGHLAVPLHNALSSFRDGNYDLSLYLYLILADTGLEVAGFNLAYLCELNTNGAKSFISKDCEWRHYNLSTQREFQFVDSYSYIKMGDYYWYGCKGHRDLNKAAWNYHLAALKGDPQALFNLAFMVEEGANVSELIWLKLAIRQSVYSHKMSLLLELYARCRESKKSEAFIPCCLAWFRIWSLDVYEQYYVYLQITSFLGVAVVVATSLLLLYQFILQRQRDREIQTDTEEDERLRREDMENI